MAVAKYAGRQLCPVILMSQVSKEMTVNTAVRNSINLEIDLILIQYII